MLRLIFFCVVSYLPLALAQTITPQSNNPSISLNFQAVPVRTVLHALADFTHTNMVISERVNGNITIRLHQLPWQQALQAVLMTAGLQQRQIGHVILIDQYHPPPRLHSPKKVGAIKKQTSIYQTALIQIRYAKAHDIEQLLNKQSQTLLSKQGVVGADDRTNLLWIQETPKRIERIKLLIKHLDIPHQQVVIEARIVNMSKECAEDLGVRFGITQAPLSGTLAGATQLSTGVSPELLPLASRLNVDLSAIPLGASPASMGMAIAKFGHHALLDLELSALESEGRAKIIANPSLMTTNQQTAVIEAGEDIPYQESNLNGATSIAFKKAVLSLKVTPQITEHDQLLMDLFINQDSDSGQRVQGVPIILTKSITTKVLVKHGETIVLGGIYKQEKSHRMAYVPFLGTLPIIGHLFRREQRRIRNEELLIFITPRIMSLS